jgi:hypothetical protein
MDEVTFAVATLGGLAVVDPVDLVHTTVEIDDLWTE